MRLRFVVSCALYCAPAGAQQIPVRHVGAAEAVAATKIDAQSLVRPLSDGRVIVTRRRSVGILSADLKTFTSIADSSTIARSPSYYAELPIIAGRGDTTYVVDEAARGLILVDPSGTAGKMIAVPKAGDMGTIAFVNVGTFRTFMDPSGRLFYRSARVTNAGMADTFPIIRADFDSRAVDTIASIRIANPRQYVTEKKNDETISRTIMSAVLMVDAWTLLPDGTVAIVRSSDYHVDWIRPDGSRSSSPKMPFDWRRITDEEKTQIQDSLVKVVATMNTRDSAAASRSRSAPSIIRVTEAAPISSIPDYFPPIREGAVRSDPEGNLWILPLTSSQAQGGLLYDVVNRNGELFQRVQMPPGCALAGFGKEKIVFVTCTATSLERRRIVE